MAFAIDVHPPALDDIGRFVRRITRTVSAASASRWHHGILAKIRTLASDPVIWPLADEAEILQLDLRVLLYGRGRQIYRILFTIDGLIVNIHRVRHASQDWLTEGEI